MLRPTRTKRRPASRQKKTATGARKNEGPCWTLRWKDGQREAFWWRVNWSRVSRTWIHIRYITTTMNRHTPNRHTGNSAGHSASDRYKIYRHNNQALQENQECNGSKNARWHLQFKYFYSFYKTSVAAFLSWCVSVIYCVVCFVSVSSTTLLSSLRGTRVNLQDRFLPVSGTAGRVLLPVLTAQSKTINRAAS